MIPKIIHYCWLSGDEFPPLIKKCINTWKRRLPDYEIICWDKHRFSIDSNPWVQEAYNMKKYAFAADYIRFYALYNYGGIYLDSDVEVLKKFDDLLNNHCFLGYENVSGLLEPAIIGAEIGMQWCKDMMDYYESRHFIGSTPTIAPIVINELFEKKFKDFPIGPVNSETYIANKSILLCPAEYFSPIKSDKQKNYNKSNKDISEELRSNPKTYCIHRFNGSWVSPFRKKVYDLLYLILGKESIIKLKNIIHKK